jgi:hypothetical protein
LFLGDQLLPFLVLAMGGAMVVGNVLALLRPPPDTKKGELQKAPMGRTVTMIVLGAIASIWALGSLVAK